MRALAVISTLVFFPVFHFYTIKGNNSEVYSNILHWGALSLLVFSLYCSLIEYEIKRVKIDYLVSSVYIVSAGYWLWFFVDEMSWLARPKDYFTSINTSDNFSLYGMMIVAVLIILFLITLLYGRLVKK